MPDLPHLHLRRVDYLAPRKKRRGFGSIPPRDFRRHGEEIQNQVQDALQELTRRPPPRGINPALILRVKLVGHVDEDTWRRSGLTLVGKSEEKTLVLFSSDNELRQFREQLETYRFGPQQGRRNAPHAGLFSNIEELGRIQPVDRIGRLFRGTGVVQPEDFLDGTTYTVDLELWHTGNTEDCRNRLAEIRRLVIAEGGLVTDDYVGPSLVLARVKAGGQSIRTLLTLDAVAVVDLPPRVSMRVSQQLNVALGDLGAVPQPPQNASGICVLDSGMTPGHPLLSPAIGEATAVPGRLGDPIDEHGHGTMVAGLALYGDVQQCIDQRTFVPQLRLFSARVLNRFNEFDDENLITTQMRGAIEYFRNSYGCRVFNASLGDGRTPYNGGKVSPWASILDHLARELDVLIVVSAGNYEHDPMDGQADEHVQGYPAYLFRPPAKVIEPATGCIVLTVGALANSADVPLGAAGTVGFRPIAQPSQPSPFTRSGPGIGGAIKPELCEYGGNLAYDGRLRQLQEATELSAVSMNREYLERLFNAGVGTSYAAPRVAHVASRLFGQFPNAQANLVRALLASSAEVPQPARDLLEPLGPDAVRQLCGYGLPAHARAANSNPNRVVLYAQDNLPFDMFHIYEVPIPEEIYDGDGERRISVTLAFDPPVRHSRLDYLGTTMSFRLIRGRSLEQVAEAFRQRTTAEPQAERIGSPFDCPMDVRPTEREGGTLQKAVFSMRRAPRGYGDTYYLVVRCQREWALDEHAPQRYGVVVTVEHTAEVNLHARIQARIRIPVRLETIPSAHGLS